MPSLRKEFYGMGVWQDLPEPSNPNKFLRGVTAWKVQPTKTWLQTRRAVLCGNGQ
jgi:hypothetical protein